MTWTFARIPSVTIRDAASSALPAAGSVMAFSLNTPADVDPCPDRRCGYSLVLGQAGVFSAWCGGAFAPGLGAMGSLLHTGGGHGDYGGNEVYRFDFHTRLWTRLTEPHPYGGMPHGVPDGQWPWDPEWGDFLDDHSPVSSHNLGCLAVVDGKLHYPLKTAVGVPSRQCSRASVFDPQSAKWSRLGEGDGPKPGNGVNGACYYDPVRNVIWAFAGNVGMLDLASGKWTNHAAGEVTWQWGTMFCHDPVSGYGVALLAGAPADTQPIAGVLLFDPSNPARAIRCKVSGRLPAPSAPGFAYSPLTDRFYIHNGNGSNDLHVLARPSDGDVATGTWTLTTERFSGPAGAQHPLVYTKLHWVPALEALAYYGGIDRASGKATGAVYLYRPRGATASDAKRA
jgi:hypothetical protein